MPGERSCPHPHPFDIGRNHPPLGLIDAANLFVLGRFPVRAIVAIDVEHDRDLALEFGRFVQQGRYPHAWHRLVAQPFDSVTSTSFDFIHPLHLGGQLAPASCLASVDYVLQHLPANLGRGSLPLVGGRDGRHLRHAPFGIQLHFGQRRFATDDRALEKFLDLRLIQGQTNLATAQNHQQAQRGDSQFEHRRTSRQQSFNSGGPTVCATRADETIDLMMDRVSVGLARR